jgi:uncharacterized protein (TIGR02996 family)
MLDRIAKRIGTSERDQQFIITLLDNPGDESIRKAYCDWLLEQGDVRGEYLRGTFIKKFSSLEASTQHRERQAVLRQQIEPLWLGFICGEGIRGVVTGFRRDRAYVDLGGLEGILWVSDMSW